LFTFGITFDQVGLRNAVTLGVNTTAFVQRSNQVHLHTKRGTSLFGFAQDDQSFVINRTFGGSFFNTLFASDRNSTTFDRMRTFTRVIFTTAIGSHDLTLVAVTTRGNRQGVSFRSRARVGAAVGFFQHDVGTTRTAASLVDGSSFSDTSTG
jgi:hypothetical protein